MSKPCLYSLDSLLLCVLLRFRESCGAVEDLQVLEPLLKNLTVVADQTEWVAQQIHHLDALKRFERGACLSEVAKLIEGDVEAEQVGEVVRDCAQCRCFEHVVSNTQVNQRLKWLAQRLDLLHQVTGKVELAQLNR